jgi:hypothetical protein
LSVEKDYGIEPAGGDYVAVPGTDLGQETTYLVPAKEANERYPGQITWIEDDAIEVFEAQEDPITWVDIAFASAGIVLVVVGLGLALL